MATAEEQKAEQPRNILPTSRFRVDDRNGTPRVTVIEFSADGQLLAIGTADGQVELWELSSAEKRAGRRMHAKPVIALAFRQRSPSILSFSADGEVKGMTLSGRPEMPELPRHPKSQEVILSVGSGPVFTDGLNAVTVCYTNHQMVRFETVRTKRIPAQVSLAVSPDGHHLLWASEEKVVLKKISTGSVLWRHDDGDMSERSLHSPYISGAAFSPSGAKCAVGVSVGGQFGSTLAVLDAMKGSITGTLVVGIGDVSFDFLTDETRIITWGDRGRPGALLWSIPEERLLAVLVSEEELTAAGVCRSRGRIAASEQGGAICVWEIGKGLRSQ